MTFLKMSKTLNDPKSTQNQFVKKFKSHAMRFQTKKKSEDNGFY